MKRYVYIHTNGSLASKIFHYSDEESSIYYVFDNGDNVKPEVFIFFYGGSGCASWRSVMPDYAKGLPKNAKVFVLNKRFVEDKSLGFGCSDAFHKRNNPKQWMSDYNEFITAMLRSTKISPKAVVLVGVSEGVDVAVKMATLNPKITHLVLIGSGGYTMRKSLKTLEAKGDIPFIFNVNESLKKIAQDPNSLEKTWFGNPYRWWSDVLDYDPIPAYLSLNIPILLAIGEDDSSVPVESVNYLINKFKEAGKNNLNATIYPNANHRLQSAGKHYREEFFSKLSSLID
jgi:pimeloyl-ACP methyl ester carboxylesterase